MLKWCLRNRVQNTIYYVVKRGNKELVEFYLKYKPNINIKNKKGETPLSLAEQKYPEIAELLKEYSKR